MPLFIDAHQDLAWNMQTYDRDYRRSVTETRHIEANTDIAEKNNGAATIGWQELQQAQTAIIFSTIFAPPVEHSEGVWDKLNYANTDEGNRIFQGQMDFYDQWMGESPDMFCHIRSRSELNAHLQTWREQPSDFPTTTHPVGLVWLLEGAEGIRTFADIEDYWQRGLRIIGPVWAGFRFCGGTHSSGGFTEEGRELLKRMAKIGYILDISHMTEASALEALDLYEGHIIASHANCRVINGSSNERHFTDLTIKRLVQRGGVMGIIPYNRFLDSTWTQSDPRDRVTMKTMLRHLDHICQIAGSANHAAFGTDFDGGFGFPHIPLEMDTIADIQKMEPVLRDAGYTKLDIDAIFGGNWQRMLEVGLPA